MSTYGNSKTVQKFGKTLHNSVPIAYRYNAEYAVKSSSSLIIVCAQIKMSTYGNSKTVQKFGKKFLVAYSLSKIGGIPPIEPPNNLFISNGIYTRLVH